MLNLDLLRELFIISTVLGTVTCTFVQKTKSLFPSSKYLTLYSLVVNLIMGLLFSYTFTSISFPNNLWLGLISFLGSDSIYKTFEGKITSYSNLKNKYPQYTVDKDENIE